MRFVPERLSAWLFQLRGAERGEVVLVQRRIFILPSRSGLLFGFVLLLMLTGSINYNLSLGFILTFLLASLGVSALLHTYRNLVGLRIGGARTSPVFAGDTARFPITIANPTRAARFHLVLSRGPTNSLPVDVGAEDVVTASVEVPAPRRGLLFPGRLELWTRFPVGLFHVWSYVHLDLPCLVYPAPAPPGVPLPVAMRSRDDGVGHGRGSDDFAGLRQYATGDSPRHIAWKAAARSDGLLTKQFTGRAGNELLLSLDILPRELDVEEKLSRLTRWVLDAHAQQLTYALRLGETLTGPGHGDSHRDRCLQALALFEQQKVAASS